MIPCNMYTVLLEYFTGIIFYEFVILDIWRVFNFTILSLLVFFCEWPMNEYQTKHLLNISHNIIIEAS